MSDIGVREGFEPTQESLTFFPFETRKRSEILKERRRFVYYTNAETAALILKNKEVWMRNTRTMNDFMEVEHGLRCLSNVYNAELGAKFKSLLDSVFAGISSEIEKLFNDWQPHIHRDTYITCLSEHFDHEDQNGRLSMWRAYGGKAGVAIVLNSEIFFSRDIYALGAFSSPVAYLNESRFASSFAETIQSISDNLEFVRSMERKDVIGKVFHMFRYAALCTKHPGFEEEKEWRVIASPSLHPDNMLEHAVESVHGTPQNILKIKLEDHPDKGVVGMKPIDLINRIIIGPCENPDVITEALINLMKNAGIEEASSKIFVSDIPLR